YLNRVYFGAGTYGVDAASRRYFGRSARDLDLYQSAMLAGLLKAPSRYNPSRDKAQADARARQVLASMVDAGFADSAAAACAAKQGTGIAAGARGGDGDRYFADWVLDRAMGCLGHIDRDIIIVTTLEPALQRAAEDTLNIA